MSDTGRTAAAKQRLLGIQAGRGAAALLVVFYHASRMIDLPQYAGHVGLHGVFQFGHAGVDFFFVLSGFIIYYVHGTDIDRPQNLARYAWRRVTRIYPSYWLVTAFVVWLMAMKHNPELTIAHFAKSILLFPDSRPPFLEVAWTLIHEMLFYSVFAIAILNLRAGLVVALVVLGFVAMGAGHFQDPVFKLLAAFRNLQFLFGIAAAYAVLNFMISRPLILFGAGAILFFAVGLAENAGAVEWDGTVGSLLFAAASGLVITGLAAAERDGAFHMGKVAELFGGSSYLLYLVHTIVVGLVFRALAHMGFFAAGIPDWAPILLAALASVGVAAFLYRFEKPALSFLHELAKRTTARRLARSDGAAP